MQPLRRQKVLARGTLETKVSFCFITSNAQRCQKSPLRNVKLGRWFHRFEINRPLSSRALAPVFETVKLVSFSNVVMANTE